MNRILFTGGQVFDGTGTPPVPADLVVRGDRIESVRLRPGGGTEAVADRSLATRWSTARARRSCPASVTDLAGMPSDVAAAGGVPDPGPDSREALLLGASAASVPAWRDRPAR